MQKFRFYMEEEPPDLRVEELEKAVGDFVDADCPLALEVVFVDEEGIRTLNAEQRGIDTVTDVLSFPSLDNIKGKKILKKNFPWEVDEEGNLVLGSIVICKKRAEEQAEEYGHSYERELHYLLVHGVMHCLGYDHIEDEDKKEMREKEELILSALQIVRE